MFSWSGYQENLHDPEGRPADHIACDDCQHQVGYFAMRALLLFRLGFRPQRPELPHDQVVEDHD